MRRGNNWFKMNRYRYPTPYDDVNIVLRHFEERIRTILDSQFLGMYLYGSLALGDFDPPTSDIDFIVVTEERIADNTCTMLQEMHEQFDTGDSSWAGKVEATYISQEALHHSTPSQVQYPQLEKGEKLLKAPLETGWAFQLFTLRERGVVIAGPDPRTITDPVDAAGMQRAVAAIARGWQEQANQDPDWLEWVRHRDAQSFVVLTLCRMLYSLAIGDVASKPAAARWAIKTLDQRWAALIDRSLTGLPDQKEESNRDLEETLEFIRYTVEKSQTGEER